MEQYRVITKDSVIDLQDAINNAITNGWTVQGGLAVSYSPNKQHDYFQAMTRNKN